MPKSVRIGLLVLSLGSFSKFSRIAGNRLSNAFWGWVHRTHESYLLIPGARSPSCYNLLAPYPLGASTYVVPLPPTSGNIEFWPLRPTCYRIKCTLTASVPLRPTCHYIHRATSFRAVSSLHPISASTSNVPPHPTLHTSCA